MADGEFNNINPVHNLTIKEHNALIKFTKICSLVFKKADKEIELKRIEHGEGLYTA